MEEKLIDLEIALDRLDGDKEFLVELLNEMNDQMGPTLVDIEQAVALNDYDQLRAVAHGMKGASSNLGVDRIAAYFKKLEEMGVARSAAGAERVIEKIKQAHIELLEYLKTI